MGSKDDGEGAGEFCFARPSQWSSGAHWMVRLESGTVGNCQHPANMCHPRVFYCWQLSTPRKHTTNGRFEHDAAPFPSPSSQLIRPQRRARHQRGAVQQPSWVQRVRIGLKREDSDEPELSSGNRDSTLRQSGGTETLGEGQRGEGLPSVRAGSIHNRGGHALHW